MYYSREILEKITKDVINNHYDVLEKFKIELDTKNKKLYTFKSEELGINTEFLIENPSDKVIEVLLFDFFKMFMKFEVNNGMGYNFGFNECDIIFKGFKYTFQFYNDKRVIRLDEMRIMVNKMICERLDIFLPSIIKLMKL